MPRNGYLAIVHEPRVVYTFHESLLATLTKVYICEGCCLFVNGLLQFYVHAFPFWIPNGKGKRIMI